jgi:hypothetical protein
MKQGLLQIQQETQAILASGSAARKAAHEGGGLGGAVDAVHANIFPLDGEGAAVAGVVEGDDDVLELDIAVAEGTEIPLAARVAEVGVTAEDANGAVAVAPPDVLHVGVVNAVSEDADELYVVHALVAEVRRIVVEPK